MRCSKCKMEGHNANNTKFHSKILDIIKEPKVEVEESKVEVEESKVEVEESNIINKSQYVLELCPIPESINQNKLKEYITEYMEPRIKFYKDTNRSYSIEDEFSEWWISNASSGCQVGKGHEATDVITSNNEAIDVMCVIMNNTQSNEKSLIQNFKESGNNLDALFENKEYNSAISLYTTDLKKKLTDVCSKYDLHNMYILAYITMGNEVYIVCFKYNISLLDRVVSIGCTMGKKSINMGNFINSNIGNVKLYKSKKRVELRLTKKCISDNPYAIKIY